MADTTLGSAGRVLRLIRPSGPANNPEMVALRAECEGWQLALSLAQEALREERSDEEHWRDEAKHLRELLAAPKREPEISLAELVPAAGVSRAQLRRSTRARARCQGRVGSPEHRNGAGRIGNARRALSMVGDGYSLKVVGGRVPARTC